MKSTLLALALTSIASAQSTTSLYLVGAEDIPGGIVASVVKSEPTAVVYAISCATATGDDCPFPASVFMTQGPSTLHVNFQQSTEDVGSVTLTVSADLACSITDSKSGVCISTAMANSGTSSFSTVKTITITDASEELDMKAVTVVGASATSSGASATGSSTGSTSPTGGPTTSALTGSRPQSSGASPTGGSSSGATPASASTTASTGGMPMITGNAQWVLGGAAAAIAIGAM